jgi:hypothetical protein
MVKNVKNNHYTTFVSNPLVFKIIDPKQGTLNLKVLLQIKKFNFALFNYFHIFNQKTRPPHIF